MIKVSQKKYEFPLSEKITILGTRITTSNHPQAYTDDTRIIITDNWLLQLAYSASAKQAEPKLLEIPIAWEEIIPWDQAMSGNVTVTYIKRPKILAVNTAVSNPTAQKLNLTIETLLSLDCLDEKAKPLMNRSEPPPPGELTFLQNNFRELEENCHNLSALIQGLEQRLAAVEDKLTGLQTGGSGLSGYVLDSFHLIPVSKAILEFYQNENPEPCYKLAANSQGYYAADDLAAGTYNIRVKHPRYAPLIINSYVIADREKKSQDFLLKRF